jgi:putative dehydrogenase
MSPRIAVMGAGAMGSAVGKRLHEHGATVLTCLEGRSDAAHARAQAAGMVRAGLEQIVACDFILSIVPPSEALGLAWRLASELGRVKRQSEPVFIDCNAISAQTARKIGEVVESTGVKYVDASIIGFPPLPGDAGPAFYVAGPSAERALALSDLGLDIRVLDAPVGAASALKMSYAGITKGIVGLASAMILSASRAGAGEALRRELERSQPMLFARFLTALPDMYPKAYRWVAEMQEIAEFAGGDDATRAIYEGLAELFERLASDSAGDREEVNRIDGFLKPER